MENNNMEKVWDFILKFKWLIIAVISMGIALLEICMGKPADTSLIIAFICLVADDIIHPAEDEA